MKNRRPEDLTALLLIDIDRFKMINDTFGHDIGDKILIEFAYRMTQWNRYGVLLARLGGDEFAAMINGHYTKEDVEELCHQITEFCSRPIVIEETPFSITVSIGASIAGAENCDARTLLQNADLAADRAQSQGYNGYVIFDPVMSKDFRKSLEIEFLLKNADVKKDFELFYQPQYAIPQKKLVGAEALIRWNTPEHGYIPPNVFIPIAEQGDAIHQIGRWVMQEAISQAAKWNRDHALSQKIGFNVSPKQLEDPGFIDLLRNLVSETGASPEWIDVEITESTMLSDEDKIRDIFAAFEKLRISVSIDDFGTGYSALSCLGKYSFDRIKIDKSLVDEISEGDDKRVNVIQAAINMAHATGMQAIAEGVERQEQLDILMELGCDQIQGYLLGRPVPADIFEQKYIEASLSDKKAEKGLKTPG
ncbi:MAG TPA: bifunctional diguanylate cyclase/phosphodiesterase [Oscillospiraceae bacterium]|nr:bifunctional diguanylate cyclase/phosphodiesterase [Oscillospiraceae bacterium]HRW56621.1 bifunctional diguanylate cyclase/phosphodiesterase [Oscillospiraceae bacterium]